MRRPQNGHQSTREKNTTSVPLDADSCSKRILRSTSTAPSLRSRCDNMALNEEFKDFVMGQLEGLEGVTVKKMFGGAGIYHKGVFFGLIANDILYLKADDSNKNDYIHNLSILFKNGSCDHRSLPLLASAVPTYHRETVKFEEKKELKKSEWFGEVGLRNEYEFKLLTHRSWENNYGSTTHLNRMVDRNGNIVVWFGSKKIGPEGEWVRCNATIKKHDEYKEVKNTIVTRVFVK